MNPENDTHDPAPLGIGVEALPRAAPWLYRPSPARSGEVVTAIDETSDRTIHDIVEFFNLAMENDPYIVAGLCTAVPSLRRAQS
ncbi:MAG: hypothetical protein SFX72_13950 [Isosphaeraceae bacterium]|nr:hypothetical protein [Isosphaeraceae bacterium]